MTRNILTFTFAIAACALMATPSLEAQCSDCGSAAIGGRIGGRLGGRISRPGFGGTVVGAARDNFSPYRVYAHSNTGAEAANIHEWNNNQQNVYAWHGGYQNWRWGTPTALVVPPTASYMSSYAWGVGQTRSTPIHHQFGRGNAAMVGGGNGEQGFRWTPYWPQSTDQFGIYPVRSPW